MCRLSWASTAPRASSAPSTCDTHQLYASNLGSSYGWTATIRRQSNGRFLLTEVASDRHDPMGGGWDSETTRELDEASARAMAEEWVRDTLYVCVKRVKPLV